MGGLQLTVSEISNDLVAICKTGDFATQVRESPDHQPARVARSADRGR
jgi:hypothetical protein